MEGLDCNLTSVQELSWVSRQETSPVGERGTKLELQRALYRAAAGSINKSIKPSNMPPSRSSHMRTIAKCGMYVRISLKRFVP
ncbi:Uncharacterized protein HZ326_15043 [Fusarium oxysporum f. sp. albedinis]|nr:Uncharacterized protein HZ326_15043 [Fusarium oxysporum f. sp. albedinis]